MTDYVKGKPEPIGALGLSLSAAFKSYSSYLS